MQAAEHSVYIAVCVVVPQGRLSSEWRAVIGWQRHDADRDYCLSHCGHTPEGFFKFIYLFTFLFAFLIHSVLLQIWVK